MNVLLASFLAVGALFAAFWAVAVLLELCQSEEEREARASKRALREQAESEAASLVDQFIRESSREAPRALKHPKAAVLRHAWRRAKALEAFSGTELDKERYRALAKLIAPRYHDVAPTDAYGKVPLRISQEQMLSIGLKEQAKGLDRDRVQESSLEAPALLACIYLGVDTARERCYVGQTSDDPSKRWRQHQKQRTGPFKEGAAYANWTVLREHVPVQELDYWEAYYIGRYDSYVRGHDETKGNDLFAYELGLKERHEQKDVD
jgi:hypothetical protein